MSTRDDIPDIPEIAQLPREALPARDLWPEIEARLGQPVPVPRRSSALLRLAAAVLLFASGVAVGHVWGRSSVETPVAVQSEGSLAPAAEVQRAGTEYVAALAALRSETRAEVRGQGREAALAALFGAAHELTRLTPEDDAASQVLSTLSQARREQGRRGEMRAVHF
jgi:hypothetical protein